MLEAGDCGDEGGVRAAEGEGRGGGGGVGAVVGRFSVPGLRIMANGWGRVQGKRSNLIRVRWVRRMTLFERRRLGER